MRKEDIEKVNKLAGKDGDLESAALEFLGLENKRGSEAAVYGIVEEVSQWNAADAETREGIEAYKSAKASGASKGKKAGGRSKAKAK